MANSKTLVWQFKDSALNPTPRSQLGFVQVPHALAAALVIDGSAQWPRIGAYRFNFIQPRPGQPPLPPDDDFPDGLFGVGDVGGVFEIARMDLCYQDLEGAIPVTDFGQVVLSIRARNNPNFLIKFNPIYSNTPCTYELDSQGYPYIYDTNPTSAWTVYGMEDTGASVAVDAYTVILCNIGTYDSTNATLGAGSTVIGETDGAMSPYTYSGVYATETPVDSGTFVVTGSLTADATTDTLNYSGENLDDVPFVFAVRVTDGEQTMQINLEPEGHYSSGAAQFPPPVGMRFWVGDSGGWYGGVLISRWLDDQEYYDTQIWTASLAGKTLVAPPAFDPLDLFLPGDIGGFYNTNDMDSLFQTRTGPTVPVTANGQPVQFIVDQNGQFNLSRPLANNGYTLTDGLLEFTKSDTLNTSLTSAVINGFAQATVVMGGWIDPASLGGASSNVVWASTAGISTANGGIQLVLDSRATPRLALNSFVGGSLQAANNNIPVEELASSFVIGARVDSSLSAQEVFCNDLEFVANIAYEGMNGSSNFALVGSGATTSPAIGGVGPSFFINRLLNDTELALLKAWMRDNTPTP